MNTKKFFNQSQLLKLSGLTQTHLRVLKKYGLIEDRTSPVKHTLQELIYCRVVFLLKIEYSMQHIRELLKPCNDYDDNLITEDFALISLDEPIKLTAVSLETPEYKAMVKNTFIVFDRKILFKKNGCVEKINFICINLLDILTDLANRAIDLDIDRVDLKFADFLNQASEDEML